MLKQPIRSSIFIVSIILFLVASGYSEQAKKIKGPIVITSEKLTADNKTNTALFENSVIARTSNMTIFADRMLVYSDKGSGDVKRIDASGNVRLIRDKRVITSKEATYYADSEIIIFTGTPKAVEDNNVISGEKMTYYINEDRFLIDNSKVFLQKETSN